MSDNRRACGAHQREFFHNYINNNLKSRPSEESTFINSKSSHANHLFDLWQCGYHQKVFSNRLGLTYTACFTANGTNFIRKHPKCVMYRKHFYDFKLTPSDNPRTRRKQETRFKPKCNRVFRSGKSDLLDNINDKLGAGRRYRFLFLGTQHIYKVIHHLKYKRHPNKKLSDSNDYAFKIPCHSQAGTNSLIHNRLLPNLQNTLTVHPTQPPVESLPPVVTSIPNIYHLRK